MYPVLISIGSFSISSFGFFLSLGFLVAVYLIWRLCRLYDINEEKILDISLLTFFGGLIGARLYFVLANLSSFDSISKIILVNRYPGLIFWGGLLGGSLSLILLTKRFRIDFWHIADFVIVGVFAALALGSLGCLLGSCQSGFVSNAKIAVDQIGLIGKRFPIQFFESLIFLLIAWKLWRTALKFHFNGKVLSVGLIYLGIIKFIAEFFRGEKMTINAVDLSDLLALICIGIGTFIFYKQSKRSPIGDIKFLGSARFRKSFIPNLLKECYNLITASKLFFSKTLKNVLKSINVKPQQPKY